MKKYITLICLLVFNNHVHSEVTWKWSFDTEAGILITDGSFSDSVSNYTFTILSFHVSQSTLPGNIGGTYIESQPTQGFI